MDNASKALLMAGSVLIGVLILSLMAYMFFTYGNFGSEIYSGMQEAQLNRFNTKFLKYVGTRPDENDPTKTVPVLCTAYDIIDVVNLAKQNNVEYYGPDYSLTAPEMIGVSNNENTMYVQIDVENKEGSPRNITNIENQAEDYKLNFIKANSLHLVDKKNDAGDYEYDDYGNKIKEYQVKYYICTASISNITKRVYYLKFTEYTP